MMGKGIRELFLKHVSMQGSGCWFWTGALHKNGYGAFKNPISKKTLYAHRAAWIIYRGEIPTKMNVCHTCDIRNCVKPDHLFLGTQKDNILDAKRKGRLPQIGETAASAKLTAAEAKAIADLYRRELGVAGQRVLARVFGVARTTVESIITGRNWRSVVVQKQLIDEGMGLRSK